MSANTALCLSRSRGMEHGESRHYGSLQRYVRRQSDNHALCENAVMNTHRRSRTRGTTTRRQVAGWGRMDQIDEKDGTSRAVAGWTRIFCPPAHDSPRVAHLRRGHTPISTRGADPEGGRAAVHPRVDIPPRKGVARRGAGRRHRTGRG
jgi:hypothetical protein